MPTAPLPGAPDDYYFISGSVMDPTAGDGSYIPGIALAVRGLGTSFSGDLALTGGPTVRGTVTDPNDSTYGCQVFCINHGTPALQAALNVPMIVQPATASQIVKYVGNVQHAA